MPRWAWVILFPLYFYPALAAYFAQLCSDTGLGLQMGLVLVVGLPLVSIWFLVAWLAFAVLVYKGPLLARPGGGRRMMWLVLALMAIGAVAGGLWGHAAADGECNIMRVPKVDAPLEESAPLPAPLPAP